MTSPALVRQRAFATERFKERHGPAIDAGFGQPGALEQIAKLSNGAGPEEHRGAMTALIQIVHEHVSRLAGGGVVADLGERAEDVIRLRAFKEVELAKTRIAVAATVLDIERAA